MRLGARERFVRRVEIAADPARVWAFHEAPDAFARLQPPWERAEIVRPPASLAVGTRVVVRVRVGPVPVTIEAEHVEYEFGRSFADRMVRGPFRYWLHRHRVEPGPSGGAVLIDEIEYELPGGALGRALGGAMVRRRLERLFDYRHRVTREACEAGQ